MPSFHQFIIRVQFYTTAWGYLITVKMMSLKDKEMKQYEEYPSIDVDLDPLTWWKDEQKIKLPVLESLLISP